ncbi:MAG: hypothetical protein K8L91_22370 [Anaerolineae bacterium]|nr:hypothetical protein [Anaerolineae bacterium]
MSVARREAEKEKLKKRSQLVPVLAFVLVLSVIAISFLAAPLIVDTGKEKNEDFNQRVLEAELKQNELFKFAGNSYSRVDVAAAVFLSIVLLAISFMIVAAALGGDFTRKEEAVLPPNSNDPRAIRKYEKKRDKIRQQKIKEVKRLKEIQDREMRKRGQG